MAVWVDPQDQSAQDQSRSERRDQQPRFFDWRKFPEFLVLLDSRHLAETEVKAALPRQNGLFLDLYCHAIQLASSLTTR